MDRDYYTAREAIAKLGLSKTEFHRRASQGLIPRFTPTGKKQSVYPKAEIDALARSMSVLFESHDRFIFSKSTIAEQEQEMIIGIRCFGREFITPLPQRIGFQQKSEYTFWSLKVNSRVVGYISMFRFPPDFLDHLLTGKRIERDITLKEVLPFVRLEPFNVYVDVLAMDPTINSKLRHWYAGVLMSRFADTILNLLGNGYFIRTIYTVTASPEGDRIVKHAGFRLMPNKSIVPGRVAYEFPVDNTGMQKLREISRREVYHYDNSRTED